MKRLLLLFAAAATLAACGNRKSPPLDDKVYRMFADSLETALAAGDVDFLKSHFDNEYLVDRICDSMDISASKKKQNRYLFESYISTQLESFSVIPESGTYSFLRMLKADDGKKALFRLRTNEGGINYHVFTLGNQRGHAAVRDYEIFYTGQSCFYLVAADMQYLAGDMSMTMTNYFGCSSMLSTMNENISTENWTEARNAYETAEMPCKSFRPAALAYMKACAGDSSGNLSEAVEMARRTFKNDPVVALNLIDPLYQQKRFDDLLQAINTLDSTVHDPQLDYMRGSIFFAKADYAKAITLFKEVAEREKGSIRNDCWRAVINSLLAEEKTEEALAMCKDLVARKIYTKTEIEEIVLEDQFLFELLPEVDEWLTAP
jgi:hypothetical protein